jgi:hypothetical protein
MAGKLQEIFGHAIGLERAQREGYLTSACSTDAALRAEVEALLASGNDWVEVVPNRREDSLARLTPAAVITQSTYDGRVIVLDAIAAFDMGAMRFIREKLKPLLVRVTSIDIERDHKEGEDVADITIKGEGQTSQNAILYTTKIKANPALKEYEWTPKVEAPKGGAVPFQIKGTTRKKDDDAA